MDLHSITRKNFLHAKVLNNVSPDGKNRRRHLARKRTMRIGTWNIQGISTKEVEVFREIEKNDMDIVALTETKKKGKGTNENGDYICIYSGVQKEERGSKGVMLAIKKKYKKCIKTWEQISDRILQVEMKLKSHIVVIIAVYAPNEDAIVDIKDKFYDNLTRLLESVSDRKELILLGDLNGRCGQRNNDAVVGPYGENIVNNNGERIIEMCNQLTLKITNGWFKHKSIHKYTWTQSTRGLKSIIDYVIVKQHSRIRVYDTRVMRGPECGSDHHLLISKIYFPYRMQPAEPNRMDRNDGIETISVKYNLDSFQNDSTKFLYKIRLAAKLTSVENGSPEEMYESVKTLIHQAATEALGELPSRQKGKSYSPWWNEELETLVTEKKQAYQRWLETKSDQDRAIYHNRRKVVQRGISRAKNDYWEKTCEEINRNIGNTRANRAWKTIKSMRTENKDRSGISLIGMQEWVKYYSELFTEDRIEFMNEQEEKTGNLEGLIHPITTEEIQDALHLMKNKKAPGPGSLNIELIKEAPTAVLDIFAEIFNKCLKGEYPPKEWKTAFITSIYKKGGRLDCKNYRGISVIPSIARLYGKILKTRIESQFREAEEQNGFRAGRSCIDGIFTLKNLIEKRLGRGRAVYLIFVDLHKAYDTVPLNKLWQSMKNTGIDSVYINAVKSLYYRCVSSVKVNKKFSQEFDVTKGLRQGCSLAPLLFKIYLQEALENWKRKCCGMGIPVQDDILYTLLFADDQVLIAGDEEDASYMFRKLQEEYEKWGLTISIKKTEYMRVGDTDQSDLDIGTTKIKHCSAFKYLGVTLSSNGRSTDDIANKIGQGKRVIRQLNSLLWSNNLTKKTKTSLYKSIVQSICTYGAETWELTENSKRRLMSLEMDYWRRSARISKLDHIRNDIIRRMMNVEQNIVDTIDSKRLIWYGHLQRMADNRWPKKVLQWTPVEHRKRGRPPRSWNKDIQDAMETRGLQEGDWMDRKWWRLRSEKRRQP